MADIRDQLLELWGPAGLPEGARQSRNVILAETAEAIARSLFGVAILDANLPTEESEPPTWVPEPPPQPTIQQPSQRSSQRFSLSPAKRNQLSSSQRLSLSPTKLSQPLSQRISLSPTKRGQAFGQRLSFSPSKGARSQSPYAPSSSIPFPFPSSGTFSQSMDASQADTPPTGAPSPSTALQRLSMLAEDLDITNPPTRQHSVLAYWPTARGASADDYVSSVLASSTKHIDVINERRQRAESRRRKRRSQLLGSSAAATSSQTYGTQDEWEDSGPGTGPESVPPPATQPLPKLAPPVIGSSQVPPVVPSSQVAFSSQVPQVLSQPVSGRHAMRSPGKKKKRKSGF